MIQRSLRLNFPTLRLTYTFTSPSDPDFDTWDRVQNTPDHPTADHPIDQTWRYHRGHSGTG